MTFFKDTGIYPAKYKLPDMGIRGDFECQRTERIVVCRPALYNLICFGMVAFYRRNLSRGGPSAQAICKQWLRELTDMDIDTARERSARMIAGLRVSPEGQEGMRAFLEKRKPIWTEGDK